MNKEGFDTLFVASGRLLPWHWYGTECHLDQLPNLLQETPCPGGVARKRRREFNGINSAAGGELLVPHFSIPQVNDLPRIIHSRNITRAQGKDIVIITLISSQMI